MVANDGGHRDLVVHSILDELDNLEDDFTSLLKSDNASYISLTSFFKRILQQYNLQGEYSEFYIVNEAYVRSYKYVRKGGKIQNLLPFLRKVGKNIVSELSRKSKKTCSMPEGFEVASPEENSDDECTIKEKLDIVNIAFNRLDELDKEILNLKTVENMSWKEVANYLRANGKGDFSLTALRKRQERIKKKMRKIYHSLENSKDDCFLEDDCS